MKRTPVLLVFACAIASLSLLSCDAMFENNLFGGMTHKKLTADSIKSQSPSELKETLDSDLYQEQIAEDPELKDAVLDTLDDSYDTEQGGDPGTPEGQTAAILAADVIISTDPAASQLAAGALGALQSIGDLIDQTDGATPPSTEEIGQMVSDIMVEVLPLDIRTALEGGSPTPPPSFSGMVASFLAADEAFSALNAGIGVDGSYLADVTEEEQIEIAFNAVVAGFVSVIALPDGMGGTLPSPTDEQIAEALWSAMTDPLHAGDFITVTDGAIDTLMGDAGVGNIIGAIPAVKDLFGTAE